MIDEDALNIHIEYDAVAKFETNVSLKGGILKVPKNIFEKKDEVTKIYDISNDSIDIYLNGKKEKTVSVPDYAIRCYVIFDAFMTVQENGYAIYAIQFSEQTLEDDFFLEFLEVLPKPKKNSKLEDKLCEKWMEIVAEEESEIDSDIQEGYEIIKNLYLERQE